jgi:CheY-like chemotaxis protein
MLAYSGKGRLVIQRLSLNAVIEEMAHLLQVSIGKTVAVKYNFAPDLPAVEADATQIRQVVMNLVVNASEAIGNKSGVITISTGVMHADRAYLTEAYTSVDFPEGDYVYLEVADTGCGMDAETMAKIFDPFFTTKFTGRGLGLAAALGIVRGHKGAIKISSAPGRGTTFIVLFPGLDRAISPAAESHEPKPAPGNSGTVLVIDDDDMVRTVTGRVLKQLGFTALLAATGSDGVDLFRKHAPTIVCVLLDWTMPPPSGEEVFNEIRRAKNDAAIILMSGYTEQEAMNRFAGKGLAGFLQKPYTPKDLRDKLMAALGAVSHKGAKVRIKF